MADRRVAILTAIAGSYDRLRPQTEQSSPCDWIAYVDEPQEPVPPWDMRVRDRDDAEESGRRWAKRVKILLPADIKDTYRYCIWIDGNVEVAATDFVERCVEAVEQSDGLAAWRHVMRRCVYAEAEAAIRRSPSDEDGIREQVRRYRDDGHPKNAGLFGGGILVHDLESSRRRELMDAWWEECNRGTMRDQLSLPYVARKLDFEIGELPGERHPQATTIIDRVINAVNRRIDLSTWVQKSALSRVPRPRFSGGSGGNQLFVLHEHEATGH